MVRNQVRVIKNDGSAEWKFYFSPPPPSIPPQSTGNWRRGGGVTSGPHITSGAAGTQEGRRCAPWSSGIRPQHPHKPLGTALPVPTPPDAVCPAHPRLPLGPQLPVASSGRPGIIFPSLGSSCFRCPLGTVLLPRLSGGAERSFPSVPASQPLAGPASQRGDLPSAVLLVPPVSVLPSPASLWPLLPSEFLGVCRGVEET